MDSSRDDGWPWRSREAWRDREPIRGDIFDTERFRQHARSLADSQSVGARTRRVQPLLSRLRKDQDVLARAYEAILDDVDEGRPITPAAEWIIDNFHVVEQQIRLVRRDLPPDYFRQLPKLGPGFLAGHPRIFSIAWGYIAHTDSLVEREQLAEYIRAYEARKALTLGELWALAIVLRLLLLENLRRLAELIVAASRDRRWAEGVARSLAGDGDQPPRPIEEIVPKAHSFRPSRAFAVRLTQLLAGAQAPATMTWLEDRLLAQGTSLERVMMDEHHSQSAATVTMRNIFSSLRLIDSANWEDWLEGVSSLEHELRESAGYAALDFPTRNRYRSAVEVLARGSGQSELDVARAAVQRARIGHDDISQDVGYHLVDDGRRTFEKALGVRMTVHDRLHAVRRSLGVSGYLSLVSILTLVLVSITVFLLHRSDPSASVHLLAALGVLVALPLSDMAIGYINHGAAMRVAASPLPALELRDGIPGHLRTMVAVPALLDSPHEVDVLLRRIESHHLGNVDPHVLVALVTDWPDAPEEHAEGDDELLAQARAGVRRLNADHGSHFLLLHRPRLYNPTHGVWMGHERKRGKLDELNALLRGDRDTHLQVIEGSPPPPVRYVLTLDSDTRMPRETVRALVGKLAHPLNQARLDADGHVARGYGILQPRITPSLPTGEISSLIQRAYSGRRGLDPYAWAVSDAYQDLFDEGSFTGKGLYDIDVVISTVRDNIPDNTVLSHDLLEGNYARSGLATDVEVVEEHPQSYAVMASRAHRWVRGDWQLLPWILWRHEGMGLLGTWKMLDNLRRSLVPLAVVVATVVAAMLPLSAFAAWLGAVIAIHLLPSWVSFDGRFLGRGDTTRWSRFLSLLDDLRQGIVVTSLNLVFIAHLAYQNVDAIVRTLFRLLVSRRSLLEWTSAAAAGRGRPRTVAEHYRLMAGGLVAPALVAIAAALSGPANLLLAAVPCSVWLLAPYVAQRASRPRAVSESPATPEEERLLRLIGRRTWQFFDRFVTAEEHHLPPDNVQEEPRAVAHRTSPTNIGLYLLSVVTAHDFGWIGMVEAADRLESTLDSVDHLERHRGHLLNWYDTTTRAPLLPRYVSTVDSGNLAGHLYTIGSTAREWAERAQARTRVLPTDGVRDSLVLLERALGRAAGAQERPSAWVEEIRKHLITTEEALGQERWTAVVARAEAMHVAVRGVVGTGPGEAFQELSDWAAGVVRSARSQQRDQEASDVEELTERLLLLAERADATADAMDFEFLFDPSRDLLSIGFHVESARLDEGCFDLLASEARLASFIAIAKGDVRMKHWYLLGRGVTAVEGSAALQSWTGSMFEYLMPTLVMRAPLGSLLSTTEDLAVRGQIDYVAQLGIPWGISEAAYNARDAHYTYQYSPFGVPGLGIKRGLADSLVIAPYATGLAVMVDPAAAVKNYLHLVGLGAVGRYGFYESLDFTPARVPAGEEYALVSCYMAHHQGMTLVAIGNALNAGIMRDRFHDVPMMRATELLLHERRPREVPVSRRRPPQRAITRRVIRDPATPDDEVYSGAQVLEPGIAHYSNGSLSLTLTPAGAGQVRWQGLAITRWHADPTSDETGDFIYLHDEHDGRSWSATPLPLLGSALDAESRFADDRAVFTRRSGPYETELEYRLSPERDALVRRLTIRNLQRHRRRVTVTTYAELVLAAIKDDDAHPAFSKMFVETEFLPERNAIVAHRRRRNPTDKEVWAAHVLVTEAGTTRGSVGVETDRAEFLGRGRTLRHPAQVVDWCKPTGRTGHTLDPIFSLSRRVSLPASGELHLEFWTLVASTRQGLLDLIDAHHEPTAFPRAAQLSWTQSQVEQRFLGITSGNIATFRRLAAAIVYPWGGTWGEPRSRTLLGLPEQSLLWPLSISGDLPLVVLRVTDAGHLDVARELVQAFEYWRLRRFSVDVVLLNEQPTSYWQEVQKELDVIAQGIRPRTASADSTGSIHVVVADQTDPRVRDNLLASAALVLVAGRGSLSDQLARRPVLEHSGRALPTKPRAGTSGPSTPAPWGPAASLQMFNGFGGFTEDGHEYVVLLDEDRPTPAPWTNVIANEQFGFLATAEGAGSTWWRNSRDNQITPWRNDPVSTTVSEAVYVRDDATGTVLSPTSGASRGGRHVARHGFGYTTYEHEDRHLRLRLTQCVPGHDPVKEGLLEITNRTDEPRDVTVTTYHELVLGQGRAVTAGRVTSAVEPSTGALAFTNRWSSTYADQVVLIDLADAQDSWTTDRSEFLGAQGTLADPAALADSAPLSGRTGAGLDPCAGLRTTVSIPPRASVRVRILLVAGHDHGEAIALLRDRRAADPDATLESVRHAWVERLGHVQVTTPDPAFDVMMNGWLLYQTLASRMLARVGFYQASGAYGFRDQLQDSMALVLIDPAMARGHLLRAAGRQFREGDVQHWWLPADGSGVRTRITDDVVWLAHAACRYARVTGDSGVFDEEVAYLTGEPLKPDEHERFFAPGVSDQGASLYDHCTTALERAFDYGRHGLPLMGTGDWNDGMNRVGEGGLGESVWLGWFLHATLSDFASVARARGDAAFAARCETEQELVRDSLETHGWDGEWYRRGYFDDGTPLGSATRPECRIDAIAQSWAVLSGAAAPERARQAMDSFDSRLVMEEAGVARLFTPPFDTSEPDPGYVRAYPPGVRENGGQYTHGVTWSIFAHAALGREDRAGALFSMLNPVNHARDEESSLVYRVEPYVVAADVYSVAPMVGRGGWTWYTGSSAWLFRAGLEAILGVRREGDALLLQPCLPPEWDTATVCIDVGASRYEIELRAAVVTGGAVSSERRTVVRLELDGRPVEDPTRLPVVDDGAQHRATAFLEATPRAHRRGKRP